MSEQRLQELEAAELALLETEEDGAAEQAGSAKDNQPEQVGQQDAPDAEKNDQDAQKEHEKDGEAAEDIDLSVPIDFLARRSLEEERERWRRAAEERRVETARQLEELRAENARLVKQAEGAAAKDPFDDNFFKRVAETGGEEVADPLRQVVDYFRQQLSQRAPQSGDGLSEPLETPPDTPSGGQSAADQQRQYTAEMTASSDELSYWADMYDRAAADPALPQAEKNRLMRPWQLACQAQREIIADKQSGLVHPVFGHVTASPSALGLAVVDRVRAMATGGQARQNAQQPEGPPLKQPPRSLEDADGGVSGSGSTKSPAQRAAELWNSDSEAAWKLLKTEKDQNEFEILTRGWK